MADRSETLVGDHRDSGNDLALAHELATIADTITTYWARRLDTLSVESKSDRSPVTEADRAAEHALREAVALARPADTFLGEEGGGPTASAGAHRRWIVDPIDGTANFLAGGRDWVTNIALEVDGRLQVALISSPRRKLRWEAVRTRGARCNGRPLRVSARDDLSEAVWSTYLGDDGTRDLAPIRQMRGAAPHMHQPHSYTGVADGQLEFAFDLYGGEWDFAAPKLVVEEAGGRVTDLAGTERIDAGSVLATNGRLHQQALDVIAAAGAEW
jgi:histidinol-phosphatase